MKILFVCNYYGPFSVNCGANQRSFFIMRALEKIGKVDVLQLTDKNDGDNNSAIKCPCNSFSALDHLRNYIYQHWPFTIKYLYQVNSKCSATFWSLYNSRKYDIVIFRYLQTYQLCGAPKIDNMYLDMDDIPWDLIRQYAEKQNFSLLRRIQFQYKYIISRQQGMRLKRRFKAIFYSNDKDAMEYAGTYLPNIPYVAHSVKHNHVIPHSFLFVGWLAHNPNVLGLDLFLTKVWPKVVTKYPDAILNIIGKDLPTIYDNKWRQIPNVNLMGFVKSLDDLYQQSEIVICPIYQGSGSNIKVLEALAYNKLCISSEFALRGFANKLIDQEDLLVCRNDDEFVFNICFALENPHIVTKISNSGYKKIRKYFSEETILKIISESIK